MVNSWLQLHIEHCDTTIVLTFSNKAVFKEQRDDGK